MEITGKLPYVTGIVSGAVLAVAGFLSLINSFREVAIGQIIINMLFALLTICCGAAYICIISKRRKGKLDGFAQFLLNVPLYWSCFLFIFTFIEHPVEPVIPIFAYDLLASCASVFAIYKFSALAYGRKSIYMAVVSSLCALFFIVTSAVGRFIHIIVTKNMYYLSDAPFRMVCFLGILLMLITELSCVISNGKKISRNLIFKENKADE
ncbi:MAG: hypothetical protein GX633_07250, partial [Clostridiales bacterium]|nr:hypothetical protein [Clostridiales bacterium]